MSEMRSAYPKCPVCDGEMAKSDIPKHNIYVCSNCKDIGQMIDGKIRPISSLLERHALGDDRVKAAISQPHVTTVNSFIDIFENVTRFLQMDLASAAGGFRTVLHMVENRIDSALACFTGLDLASDKAAQGLQALREARELVSTLPPATRGVKGEPSVDAATSPPE